MKLNQQLNNTGILEALAYFDVFDFPLSKEDLFRYTFLDQQDTLDKVLDDLISKGIVHQLGHTFSIRNDQNLQVKREKDIQRASDYYAIALKKSRLISKFPFVRGVFISGSLSKGVMDEKGDIDYFVVTKKNRLWISRTTLLLYRLIFLFNSRKYFCINYLVDEDNLEMSFKNRFTATELITLIPTINPNLFHKMISSNEWFKEYYPSYIQKNHLHQEYVRGLFQKLSEPILNLGLFNALESFLLKTTIRRWNWKFGHLSKADIEVAFLSSKGISKQHSGNFQKRVLQKYETNILELNSKLASV